MNEWSLDTTMPWSTRCALSSIIVPASSISTETPPTWMALQFWLLWLAEKSEPRILSKNLVSSCYWFSYCIIRVAIPWVELSSKSLIILFSSSMSICFSLFHILCSRSFLIYTSSLNCYIWSSFSIDWSSELSYWSWSNSSIWLLMSSSRIPSFSWFSRLLSLRKYGRFYSSSASSPLAYSPWSSS